MDNDLIIKITNGATALRNYFSKMYNVTHVEFNNELKIFFNEFVNNLEFRTEENKSYLIQLCELSILIDSYGKETLQLEGEEDEDNRPKNLDLFINTFIEFFNFCLDIEDYLVNTYPEEYYKNDPEEEKSRTLLSFKIEMPNNLVGLNNENLNQKTKTNKSLLLNGKELNLSERFKIANKVLKIDKEIRKLDIPDLKKYLLVAYILGCDKDTARNLMNGTYNSKDRDLTDYFNELNIME